MAFFQVLTADEIIAIVSQFTRWLDFYVIRSGHQAIGTLRGTLVTVYANSERVPYRMVISTRDESRVVNIQP